ncbi:MAG: hypothetical protein ABI389_15425 [Rhodanobacter sp.]
MELFYEPGLTVNDFIEGERRQLKRFFRKIFSEQRLNGARCQVAGAEAAMWRVTKFVRIETNAGRDKSLLNSDKRGWVSRLKPNNWSGGKARNADEACANWQMLGYDPSQRFTYKACILTRRYCSDAR